ncbi:oxygen-independent coproporphyrinogen III oxidase [Cylindrospermopsis sp. CR12]|uniref:oxygen-independent coproporphyrinogen III oxidase n=1 Tax=Cylindrospermopsis TaxID=77021 RepID=UPI00070B3CF2|nr:oxygen-independent coproporphyrinogen III oxidase [Cylindrospermopsis sp. CR12]KRH97066.1 coproporphyrinogen III oxidase [Cylindrospermopsis sp. CR12]MBU6343905.1 oxygen-independent coproporphyrinogen III oxidase [Cyanobacteria bacterium REEB494]
MVFVLPGVKFDLDLIQKYDTRAPRYTSYPPATELSETFTTQDWEMAISHSNHRHTPLSLYFHIPFCQTPCYFCGCNTVISHNKKIAEPYVNNLAQEIKNTSRLIDTSRPVLQIHWGGGTPNYLEIRQVEFLWETINRYFSVDANAEVSIEINPRYINRDYINSLRSIGFNRISFGIQDFDPQVQLAVNRIQPEKMLFDAMNWIKQANFSSVNVDLIYGLPYQNLQGFQETLTKTIALDPDRIVVFNFAYVPWMKPVQKKIDPTTLPTAQEKLDIMKMTIEQLTSHQYLFIGMDHFAKHNDELAIAQVNGTLKRNFQGYTTHAETELFGFGITAISMLDNAYSQNSKDLKHYYQSVEMGAVPISKGIQLTPDDMIRRDVIMSIMSHFCLRKLEIEAKYHINFDQYFHEELLELGRLERDGLVNLFADEIQVTDIGRLLVRNIACHFDAYSKMKESKFSRTI